MAGKDNTSVQVALRMRPLVPTEISRGCKSALELYPEVKQVKVKGTDKAFTFDHTFDEKISQQQFYNTCVSPMMENLFSGYNVTILAYGQTGSGKTHSMGTAYNGEGEMGIIPRAVTDIFLNIRDRFAYNFTVSVSFVELYQEVLYDLLSQKSRDQSVLEIREDAARSVYMPGLTEKIVTNVQETLECLAKGSLGRATSSTNMNSQSSRSHAIFTLNITIQKKGEEDNLKHAKFHLVDLAGSERSKKTGATGQTFKEGVNINKGLLALGNVISALGEEASYVGYRDSNLTRLLKDSLGGNSITLMIACISPADYNIDETISTLRYADRAKKIKNKPIVNEDPHKAEVSRLNRVIEQLRLQLAGQGGPTIHFAELEQMKAELSRANTKLSLVVNENTALLERIMLIQTANEELAEKIGALRNNYNLILEKFSGSLEQDNVENINANVVSLKEMQTDLNQLAELYKKNEDEVRRHEIMSVNTSIGGSDSTEVEINEKRNDHTSNQMEMNQQLQEVTKMLGQKQELAKCLMANANYMVDVEEAAANEAKLNAWEKEKEDLVRALGKAKETQHSSDVTFKINETRRKRIQELESQIKDLRKKVVEQARLIKMKEKDEQRIRLLNNEIKEIKTKKVDLIKKMRQETERFRQWKMHREKELCKLKDQDRKRQNQMVRMENVHSRQQNVLKRKVEEAAAINKRLKDALALRKATQMQKAGKIEHIGPWIRREVDVLMSTIEAQCSLEVLLEDRANLQSQADKLKESGGPGLGIIEDELEIRSLQIADLQQKLLDCADGDDKCKTIVENIQTMAESKQIIKSVLEILAEVVKKKSAKPNEEMQFYTELEKKFEEEKLQHQNKMREMLMNKEMEYENKVAVLLRQLRGVQVENMEEEKQIEKTILMEKVEKLEKEKEELQIKLTQIEDQLQSANSTVSSMAKPETPPSKKKKISQNDSQDKSGTVYYDDDIIEGTPMVEHDNKLVDPDWTQTKLGRWLQNERKQKPVKRTSDNGCNCKGTCKNRTCGCRKSGVACLEGCRCSSERCTNRDKENKEEESIATEDTTNDNTELTSPKRRKIFKLTSKKIRFGGNAEN